MEIYYNGLSLRPKNLGWEVVGLTLNWKFPMLLQDLAHLHVLPEAGHAVITNLGWYLVTPERWPRIG